MSRLAVGALIAVALVAVACGGSKTAGEQARHLAQEHLGDFHSGTIDLQLLAATAGSGRGTGFEVFGKYAVPTKKGRLPLADLRVTRIVGGQRFTSRFVSTGTDAFVVDNGKTTPLPADQKRELESGSGDSVTGLEGLSLDDWIRTPRVTKGPALDSTPTESVTGTLDPVPAINDLVDLAGGFGFSDGPKKLSGDSATRVRRAVSRSSVVAVAGTKDHILRRLRMSMTFAASAVKDARITQALRSLAAPQLTLRLDLTGVNKPVRVTAP